MCARAIIIPCSQISNKGTESDCLSFGTLCRGLGVIGLPVNIRLCSQIELLQDTTKQYGPSKLSIHLLLRHQACGLPGGINTQLKADIYAIDLGVKSILANLQMLRYISTSHEHTSSQAEHGNMASNSSLHLVPHSAST